MLRRKGKEMLLCNPLPWYIGRRTHWASRNDDSRKAKGPDWELRLPRDLEGVYGAYLAREYVAIEMDEKGYCCKE
jgi:hypothetical protein